ncbi:MAG: MEKHLA domain-containing protein [Synechococcaceae bacterium WB8_1B_136]|nr:MEKHLA domain-containing protein [Synechococcaceae bacterium WB8_1B_136]
MPPPAEAEAPWLSAASLALAARILRSHQRAFGRPLLTNCSGEGSDLSRQAQELFAAATVVLAHDGADPGGDPGPRLTYANRAALLLWHRPWAEQVGLPSRLTAPAEQRAGRARMLHSASQAQALSGYSGIRIDSQGRRFQIQAARLWTLWNEAGEPCGQAAAFNSWWWL